MHRFVRLVQYSLFTFKTGQCSNFSPLFFSLLIKIIGHKVELPLHYHIGACEKAIKDYQTNGVKIPDIYNDDPKKYTGN